MTGTKLQKQVNSHQKQHHLVLVITVIDDFMKKSNLCDPIKIAVLITNYLWVATNQLRNTAVYLL